MLFSENLFDKAMMKLRKPLWLPMSSRSSTYARKNAFTFPYVKMKKDVPLLLLTNPYEVMMVFKALCHVYGTCRGP